MYVSQIGCSFYCCNLGTNAKTTWQCGWEMVGWGMCRGQSCQNKEIKRDCDCGHRKLVKRFLWSGLLSSYEPSPLSQGLGSLPPSDPKPTEGSFRDMEIFEVYFWLAGRRHKGLQDVPHLSELEGIRDWSVHPEKGQPGRDEWLNWACILEAAG